MPYTLTDAQRTRARAAVWAIPPFLVAARRFLATQYLYADLNRWARTVEQQTYRTTRHARAVHKGARRA